MPVPSVAEWEWLNWRFPRPVRAGDTIYARWTLTQKRPPRDGAASSIVVWRVDVHTADGSLCAEGEVGAKVKRDVSARQRPDAEQMAGPAGDKRRRRRRSRANGAGGAMPEPPAVAAPPASAAKPERASGPARRRRRRRSSSAGVAREEEHEPRAAHTPEASADPVAALPTAAGSPTHTTNRKGLGGVLRRLRRPSR